MTLIRTRSRMMCGAALFALATVAGCFNLGIGTGPGNNDAACLTISPGDEIAARIAVEGKATKLFWSNDGSRIDNSNSAVEVIRLVAINADDGFRLGDRDARMELTLRKEGGVAVGFYTDATFTPNQNLSTFDLRISSSPSYDAVATQQATGSAEVTEVSRSGNSLKLRVKFKLPVLNLVTVQITEICGEVYFEGPITVLQPAP